MEAALHETNLAAREAMYDTIQQLLVERDFPLAWGICDKIIHAHSVDLTGFQQNYLNWLYFYPCEWRPYDYSMVISSPPNITYEVGDTGHSISWTITADPLEDPLYFIYENNSLIDSNNWTSGSPIVINVDGLSVGVTQYRIEAHNYDEIAEDTVMVTVEPPPTEEEEELVEIIPGFSLALIATFTILALVYVFSRDRAKIS